jgi:hypothetical protein
MAGLAAKLARQFDGAERHELAQDREVNLYTGVRP